MTQIKTHASIPVSFENLKRSKPTSTGWFKFTQVSEYKKRGDKLNKLLRFHNPVTNDSVVEHKVHDQGTGKRYTKERRCANAKLTSFGV